VTVGCKRFKEKKNIRAVVANESDQKRLLPGRFGNGGYLIISYIRQVEVWSSSANWQHGG
jgi:hypothetical protein